MKELKVEQWDAIINNNQEKTNFIYFYTPMCGTCQLASKMLEIVCETLSEVLIYKCNINYFPNVALANKIESVPCFTIWKQGELLEKIYAFHSVPYLYEKIRMHQTS